MKILALLLSCLFFQISIYEVASASGPGCIQEKVSSKYTVQTDNEYEKETLIFFINPNDPSAITVEHIIYDKNTEKTTCVQLGNLDGPEFVDVIEERDSLGPGAVGAGVATSAVIGVATGLVVFYIGIKNPNASGSLHEVLGQFIAKPIIYGVATAVASSPFTITAFYENAKSNSPAHQIAHNDKNSNISDIIDFISPMLLQ